MIKGHGNTILRHFDILHNAENNAYLYIGCVNDIKIRQRLSS